MSHRNKRCVITEELMSICDDFREAAALRQMLYWLPRRHDIDAYLVEEKKRRGSEMEVEPSNGWIYKSASELAEETMILSRSTAHRRLKSLQEKGYLESRENPESEWDNTLQYRLNVYAIQSDLRAEDYTLATVMGKDYPSIRHLFDLKQNSDSSTVQSETSGVQSGKSSAQSGKTFPETTTEKQTQSAGAGQEDIPHHLTDDPPCTEEEAVRVGEKAGVPEDLCREWWHHYNGRGWPHEVKSVASELKKWKFNDSKFHGNTSGDGAPVNKSKAII